MKLLSALLVFCSLGYAEVVYPGFGTIAHIADGGGIQMEFVLTNLDDTPSSYFLDFYDDHGNPLSLETSAGTGSDFSGTLAPYASVSISTAGTAANVTQGYAVVSTCTGTVGALAILRFLTGPWKGSEVVVPSDSWAHSRISVAFDNTDSAGTALAIVNGSLGYVSVPNVTCQTCTGEIPSAVSVTFRGEDGAVIVTDTFNMTAGEHRSFVTASSYPATAGKRGTIEFTATATGGSYPVFGLAPAGSVSVLALRFTPSAVSAVTPLVSSKWAPVANGNNSACYDEY